MTIETSTDKSFSGSRSLKVTKLVPGANAGFAVLIPIEIGKFYTYQLKLNKGTYASGEYYIVDYFVHSNKTNSTTFRPSITKSEQILSATRNMTSGSPTDWPTINRQRLMSEAPAWATHYMVEFNISGAFGTGSFYVDDFLIGGV